jgi:hypothetical protein
MNDRQGYGFQDDRYAEFPPVVQIALVSGVCPSNCAYCPVGMKNQGELPPRLAAELPVHYFDLFLFEKIVDEMAKYPWSILRIHSRGEPMAHPDYFRMIALAKQRGVGTVTSFTNAIYLQRHIPELLDAPIDMLEVSADAADTEHYALWRRNPHFDRIVNAVRDLFAARNARPGSPTRIVVSAVDHPDFRPHRQAFEAFWETMSDRVIVRPFHTYAGRIEDPYLQERGSNGYVPCVQLWERFSISPTGLVNACFNDWGDEEIVGDLNQEGSSIAGIWQGVRFTNLRAKALAGPCLKCCKICSGSSLSSWGKAGYQHWVRELLDLPPRQ